MTIRIILLLLINLQPPELQSFLQSKGLKANVQMINLASGLTLGNELNYFNALQAAFSYSGYRHVIVNPFYSGHLKYIVGYGTSKFSYTSWNDIPERRLHNLSAIAHELGHNLFRLKHSGTNLCKDLMDANVLACSNLSSLTYSSAQKLKIRFVQKYRRKKI